MVRTGIPTRERILQSAFTLFGRYGFRRTSIEDIASEATLSRTAVYLQFRNKEEIFRELARGLHERALSGAQEALAGHEPLAEKLRRAVEAKTLAMLEIIETSPHGSELIDEKNRLCGDLATDSERRFTQMLMQAFARADESGQIDLHRAGLKASEASQLFAGACHGIKVPGITSGQYKKRIALLSNLFVNGLRG
jgi:AcrR family transcriptional regulator